MSTWLIFFAVVAVGSRIAGAVATRRRAPAGDALVVVGDALARVCGTAALSFAILRLVDDANPLRVTIAVFFGLLAIWFLVGAAGSVYVFLRRH